MSWGLIGVGVLSLILFVFPKIELTGTGPISVRGSTPYDRQLKISFGALLNKPWSSITLKDKYDGAHHYSKVEGGWKSSPVFLLCPVGIALLITGLIQLRIKREREEEGSGSTQI